MAYFLTTWKQSDTFGNFPALLDAYPDLAWSRAGEDEYSPTARFVVSVADPPAALLTDWRFPQLPNGFPYSVADYQQALLATIDLRTLALRNAGFTWNGGTYPGDSATQADFDTMTLQAANLPYPVTLYQVDGVSTGTLTSAADMQAFHLAMVTRGLQVVSQGAALKAQVLAATSIAQLDAISDTRS